MFFLIFCAFAALVSCKEPRGPVYRSDTVTRGNPGEPKEKKRSGMCNGFKFGDIETVECIMNVIDGIVAGTPGRGDKKITADEIDKARSEYLRWYEKTVAWFAVSTKQVLKDCQGNNKGFITVESFSKNRKTCLANQADVCRLKTICDRAAVRFKRPVY